METIILLIHSCCLSSKVTEYGRKSVYKYQYATQLRICVVNEFKVKKKLSSRVKRKHLLVFSFTSMDKNLLLSKNLKAVQEI